MKRLFTILVAIQLISCQNDQKSTVSLSGAALSLGQWFAERTYPQQPIRTDHLLEAYSAYKLASAQESLNGSDWTAIGPKNIGGRTLCIAFHPSDPNTIYAGSAGGGLWKSATLGEGAQAWVRISLGYPVFSV